MLVTEAPWARPSLPISLRDIEVAHHQRRFETMVWWRVSSSTSGCARQLVLRCSAG